MATFWPDRQVRKEADGLNHVADAAPQIGRRVRCGVDAVDEHASARRSDQPVDRAQQRALSRSRRAEKNQELARRDVKSTFATASRSAPGYATPTPRSSTLALFSPGWCFCMKVAHDVGRLALLRAVDREVDGAHRRFVEQRCDLVQRRCDRRIFFERGIAHDRRDLIRRKGVLVVVEHDEIVLRRSRRRSRTRPQCRRRCRAGPDNFSPKSTWPTCLKVKPP